MRIAMLTCAVIWALVPTVLKSAEPYEVTEAADEIKLFTPTLEATIRREGLRLRYRCRHIRGQEIRLPRRGLWAGHRRLDHGAGQRRGVSRQAAAGDGLSVRQRLPRQDGRSGRSKGRRSARRRRSLSPEVIRGKDFVAVKQSFQYRTAAPGKKTGSKWTQTIVFPAGKRYFVSSPTGSTRSTTARPCSCGSTCRGTSSTRKGDTFSEIYPELLDQADPGQGVSRQLRPRREVPLPPRRLASRWQESARADHPRLPAARPGDRQRRAVAARA